MVKTGENKPPRSNASVDPETRQRQHLRSLAISKRILRRSPSVPSAPLDPSKAILKLEGRDIVKRGQRKSRCLFSFPGLLGPISGGRVGELADLSTKSPIVYMEFPNVSSPETLGEDEAIWYACLSEEQVLDAAADEIGKGGDVRGLLRELDCIFRSMVDWYKGRKSRRMPA